jgi:hypothetical protein
MGYDGSGRWFIDGKDVWNNYGLIVESGSDGFLEYPAAKQGISHDWPDQHGVDVDLSKRFLQSRDISLRCGIIAVDANDFWAKYRALISDLMLPNARRIEYAEFGAQSFYVFYNTTNAFTRFTRLLDGTVQKIACKFTLVLTENEPQLDNNNVFIIEETGKFLIT